MQNDAQASQQELTALDNLIQRSGYQLQDVPGGGQCGCHAILTQLQHVAPVSNWTPSVLRELLATHMATALQTDELLRAQILGDAEDGMESQHIAVYLDGVRTNAWLSYIEFSIMGAVLAQALQHSVQITLYIPTIGVHPFNSAHPAAGPTSLKIQLRIANVSDAWMRAPKARADNNYRWVLNHWVAVVPTNVATSLGTLPATKAVVAPSALPAASAVDCASLQLLPARARCDTHQLHSALADGVDEHELQVADTDDTHHTLRAALQEDSSGVMRALLEGCPIISSTAHTQKPASDYDTAFFTLTHPWTFPQGTGAKPLGMSLETWMRTVLQRYPREQHAQNPHLIMDFFDVLQRHQTSQRAYVQMTVDKSTMARIGALTNDQLGTVIDLLKQHLQGQQLTRALRDVPDIVTAAVKAVRASSSKVLGTPGSYASLRSRVGALAQTFGPAAVAVNLNPAELQSPLVFEICGSRVDMLQSSSNAGVLERLRIVAADPQASEAFFSAFMHAFVDVFLEWPRSAKKQVNKSHIHMQHKL